MNITNYPEGSERNHLMANYPEYEVMVRAVRVMTEALDRLVGECMDAEGKPKAPSRGRLAGSRAYLPAYCLHGYKNDN